MAISLLQSNQLQASVRVEAIEYQGWQDARRISNGVIELIVVPQIGRIMSFARIGQENILWQNAQEYGKVYSPTQKKWINYGGYKLWLAPQSELGWPPDPYVDRGCYTFERVNKQTIRLQGQLHPSKHFRLRIEVTLMDDQPELVLTHLLENHSKQTIPVSFWGVSQVKPLGQISVYPPFSVSPIWDLKLSERKQIPVENIAERQGFYHLSHQGIPDKKKVYFFLKQAKMVYNWNAYRLVKYFDPYQQDAFPNEDSNFEVYFCPQYIELETVSPMISVPPKAQGQSSVRWSLGDAEPAGR